jgi:hypothetical protein
MKLTDLQLKHVGYVQDKLRQFERDGATAAMWDNLDINRLLDVIVAMLRTDDEPTPPAAEPSTFDPSANWRKVPGGWEKREGGDDDTQ